MLTSGLWWMRLSLTHPSSDSFETSVICSMRARYKYDYISLISLIFQINLCSSHFPLLAENPLSSSRCFSVSNYYKCYSALPLKAVLQTTGAGPLLRAPTSWHHTWASWLDFLHYNVSVLNVFTAPEVTAAQACLDPEGLPASVPVALRTLSEALVAFAASRPWSFYLL